MAGPRGLAVAALAALALAACGEKPEPDLSDIPAPQGSAKPSELLITARGDREAITYATSGNPARGTVRVTLRNESPRPTTGRMVRADGTLRPAELAERLDRLPALGPPRTEPGKSSTVTVELEPGVYYVVGDQPVADRPASFEISP